MTTEEVTLERVVAGAGRGDVAVGRHAVEPTVPDHLRCRPDDTGPADDAGRASTRGTSMTGNEWIRAFAEQLGVEPLSEADVEALLDLAGVAAHASERLAAPLTCYLVGRAGGGSGRGPRHRPGHGRRPRPTEPTGPTRRARGSGLEAEARVRRPAKRSGGTGAPNSQPWP